MLAGLPKNDPSIGEPVTRHEPLDVAHDTRALEPCDPPRGATGGRPSSPAAPIERWFRDYFDTLWRFAIRVGVPRQHVDDVVQEVFITASRRAADIAAGSERRFLMSTVLKISANQRRRSARQLDRPALVEDEAGVGASGAELLEQKHLLELLYSALDRLSEEQRAVFVLHELEGFTVPEIAEMLGVPVGTAASRLGRARQAFEKSAARVRALWGHGELP